MLDTLRCVAASHNAAGRSVIEVDGPPVNTVLRNWGGAVGEIWITSAVPPDNGQALTDLAAAEVSLEPPAVGAKLRWFAPAPEIPYPYGCALIPRWPRPPRTGPIF